MSPFVWRHLLAVLVVAAHLGMSVHALRQTHRTIRPQRLGFGALRRAAAVAYSTAAALAVVVALIVFARVELDDHARRCWTAAKNWTWIQLGLSRAEVTALLGEPGETSFGRHAFYDLHPLMPLRTGAVEFDEGGLVISKDPVQANAWLPPGAREHLIEVVLADAHVASALGLVVLALVSLVPFGVASGWSSWSIYLPAAALPLAAIYELTATEGWRFDRVILAPAVVAIIAAGLLRVIWIAREEP